MLIALLAVLGVDLIALVVLVAFVLARKRWVKRQPGAFHGAVRVASGRSMALRGGVTDDLRPAVAPHLESSCSREILRGRCRRRVSRVSSAVDAAGSTRPNESPLTVKSPPALRQRPF